MVTGVRMSFVVLCVGMIAGFPFSSVDALLWTCALCCALILFIVVLRVKFRDNVG